MSSSTMMNPTEDTKVGAIPVLVNSTEFPKMEEAKKRVPYDEPIGSRIPRNAKRNKSVGKGKKNTKEVVAKEENWDEGWPMDEEEVIEVDSPEAMKDDKRKKPKKKRRKLGSMVVDGADDPPLSNEANHFRTFARRHFTIILRKMGKIRKFIKPNLSNTQIENFFILLLTFSISSEEFHKRKVTSCQGHCDRIRNSETSPPRSPNSEFERK